VVVFVKDGDILVWEEASGESRTIFEGGDAIAVDLSDDGQIAALLRRSVVTRTELDWYEQSALWAVDLDGQNARELVSAETLRGLLGASDTDSTNIPQMEWIPGTHRLLYSGWRYFVLAEGESHALPEGLYLVDTDSAENTVIVPAGANYRFWPSPNGQQIALTSPTGLSFVQPDGSDLRMDVLALERAGAPGPVFPTGAWTQDSRAFLVTGSFDWDPVTETNFTIWRVPVDGSPPDPLADLRQSHPGSVTFSPDGRQVAAIQYSSVVPPEIPRWIVAPLGDGVGPVAIPPEVEVGYTSLHWSPDGRAFTGSLLELCAGAASDADVCDAAISFSGTAAAIRWIEPYRFLVLTRYPSVLFLVTLDSAGTFDGASEPIVAWPLEEWVTPGSFAAASPGE
jgi:hypothetical protein